MLDTKILSLSTVFPRPAEEQLGPFVRHRLQALAGLMSVRVVAPVPCFDYAARRFAAPAGPKVREDGALRVYHPRWFYPPGAGSTSALFLAARLLPFFAGLRGAYPFDVVDAHFAHPSGVAAALLAGALHRPFTITLRGDETMHAQSPGKRRSIGWALRRAARVVAVSEKLRAWALSLGVPEDRVRTIPNGVDPEVFYPRPYAETRARLGIPENRPAILSAGFLIERKGHHRVIRALSEMRRRGSNAELWIVGGPGREGRFEDRLRAEVRERSLESEVHFTGNVKPATLAEFMSAADVVCLASSREGWPNVVHEAQACGAPVVATGVGGVEDMIPRPDYGFVVPAGDDAALTAALIRAVGTRWDRPGITAWGRVRSWSQVAAETADVLREAAAERTS